ncbi:TetR/AcrR family transcriptional regulator [Mycolicibacterium sp.]|uniref:TetR/AcrR family transcriptional regulator n=1 Tax=Mycolicibacterium sp. TaxID=2320850 RepID=UPI001A2B3D00|nr:TetR/AcrR family transcriptional regulator [Mycolicibacterium sp.]MBJ7336910.1 TetR/AcrR family transcriptional regulator [Mycolicibacterium sp.]
MTAECDGDAASRAAKRTQPRAVATRRRILDSAIRLFAERGYPATGTRQIIAESGMTGGAFYHHFDTKEAVASAILTESNAKIHAAFRSADAGGRALESVIRGTFLVASLHVSDAGVRVSSQLIHTVGASSGAANRHYATWVDTLGAQFARGQGQGDVRADADPEVLARAIVCATYGAWAVASLTVHDRGVARQLTDLWDVLLQAILVSDAVPYFRSFLRRQSTGPSAPDGAPS